MTFKDSPIRYLLDILGRKWTFEILDGLLEQELKFSEIEKLYPDLSGKMLSRRVKELFELGVIGKSISNMQPLEFRYYLSEKGKKLKSVFYEVGVASTRMFRQELLDDPTLDTKEIEKIFGERYG